MPANTFGEIFRVTTWGESHGGAIGAVIDGCPPRIEISESDIQKELDRRRPGQSHLTTSRVEEDRIQILSGIFEGKTLGTPISLLIWNKDVRSKDYEYLKNTFRPSHADFTYQEKFGIRNWAGGGRSSARETSVRVAAGAIAKKILHQQFQIKILAYVKQIYDIVAEVDPMKIRYEEVESSLLRCPDPRKSQKMIQLIEKIKQQGDTVGGVIECIVKNTPSGLGEPVFDRLEARLAQAMLSLPASKGFEIGSGFSGTCMKGSEHNDEFVLKKGKIGTKTNHSGGIQGGISNGEPIIFRVAFKPVSTIFQKQRTVTTKHHPNILRMKGRHDPCVLPRAVPIVEAMAHLTLMDFALLQLKNKQL